MKLRIALSLLWFAGFCKAVTVASGDTVIAQIASGGTWKTTIQLVNMGTRQAQFTVNFYDDSGVPGMFTIVGGGRAATVSGTIPVGGSRSIELDEGSVNLLQGWGYLQTTDQIGGQVILRQRISGQPDYEGSVPISSQSDRHYFMPFDQTNNFVTGFAMANTSPGTQQVLVTFRDETGTELRRATINFNGMAHQIFNLSQFPELAGKRGYAEVTVPFAGAPAAITQSVAIMGLRFSPAPGPFSTLFPVMLLSERMF